MAQHRQREMKDNIEQPWIEAGYEIFSKQGPNGLKVEQISRAVGKSKSSFYHLFADIEIFQEKLLQYHQERAVIIAAEARACKSMVPDLLNLLLTVKADLLFNRQLRVHRKNVAFEQCFQKANGMVEEAFMGIWSEAFGLKEKPHIARNIMKMTTDNFYLRVTEETLNAEWLLAFLTELQSMVKEIISSS